MAVTVLRIGEVRELIERINSEGRYNIPVTPQDDWCLSMGKKVLIT
jgi:hypothetical protein